MVQYRVLLAVVKCLCGFASAGQYATGDGPRARNRSEAARAARLVRTRRHEHGAQRHPPPRAHPRGQAGAGEALDAPARGRRQGTRYAAFSLDRKESTRWSADVCSQRSFCQFRITLGRFLIQTQCLFLRRPSPKTRIRHTVSRELNFTPAQRYCDTLWR